MNTNNKIILFDVDGVLIDSLRAHLNFCKNFVKKNNLQYSIPNPADFKNNVVRKGKTISPMLDFFKSIGFSPEDAEKGNIEYIKKFSVYYKPKVFKDIPMLLSDLTKAGFTLGYVTSNITKNVSLALGELDNFFTNSLKYTNDKFPSFSKAQCINDCIKRNHIKPENCIYIGDQINDFREATKANVRFLGVEYGWGISEDDFEFDTIASPIEIKNYILKKMKNDLSEPLLISGLQHAREMLVFSANLRSKNFNYFLMIIGFMVAAYAKDSALELPMAIMGIIASPLFFGLDYRTTQLIQDARVELITLEPMFNLELHSKDRWKDKERQHSGSDRSRLYSHTTLYRTIFIFTFIISICGLLAQFDIIKSFFTKLFNIM